MVEGLSQLLYNTAIQLLAANSPRHCQKIIVASALEIANAKSAAIFEINHHQVISAFATDPRLYKITSYSPDSAPFLGPGTELEKLYPHLKQLEANSIISIPLIFGQQKYGVLLVLSYPEIPFTTLDLNNLLYFSPLATFAIRQQKLKQQLKLVIKSRDLFISLAAHEIRSPLTTILGYSELIDQQYKLNNSLNLDLLQRWRSGSIKLKNLVNEFLSVQQIKNKKVNFNFGKVNIANLLNETADLFFLHYPNHKIVFSGNYSQTDLSLYADAHHLKLAFLNILRNAGKYSPVDTPITFRLDARNSNFLISIQDKGVGISPKDLSHVFKKYYQGENSSNSGFGLGLYLTKKIVLAHQGKISIKSKLQHGTQVSISLPRHNPETNPV